MTAAYTSAAAARAANIAIEKEMKIMRKIYRILGKKGRTTIPYELRQHSNFKANDLLSFELAESDTIVIRREKACGSVSDAKKSTVNDILDTLTPDEQRTALVLLTLKLSTEQKRGKHEKREALSDLYDW